MLPIATTPSPEHSFDPEAVVAMSTALTMARRSLGVPHGCNLLTKLLARKIVEAAANGERDPVRLYEAVARWAAPDRCHKIGDD